MKMNVWRRHSVVLLLVLFVGALACAALIYSTLWARYNNALQQLEPRSERLEGVVNAGAEIETLLSAASSTVAPLVHPAGETSQNDIQQKLRQMLMASGGTLVSSQVALEPGRSQPCLQLIEYVIQLRAQLQKTVHVGGLAAELRSSVTAKSVRTPSPA